MQVEFCCTVFSIAAVLEVPPVLVWFCGCCCFEGCAAAAVGGCYGAAVVLIERLHAWMIETLLLGQLCYC
jgi:hypothetical protein